MVKKSQEQRMSLFKKENTAIKKMLPFLICAFLILITLLFVSVFLGLQNGLEKYYSQQLVVKLENFEDTIENNRNELLDKVIVFKDVLDISEVFSEKNEINTFSLVETLKKSFSVTDVLLINKDYSINYSTLTDYNFVHKTNIVNLALKEKYNAGVYFDNGRIFNAVACPIYEERNVVGVLMLVDDITNQTWLQTQADHFAMDVTFFIDDVRLRTTIKNKEGNYATGTKLNNDTIYNIVYTDNNIFYGNNVILGEDYLTAYAPFQFTEGKDKSILFMGINIKLIKDLQFSVSLIILPLLLLLCIGLFFTFMNLLKFIVLNPLRKAGKAIHTLNSAEADLTYRIDLHRNDEIGRFCDDIDSFLGKQQDLISQFKSEQTKLHEIGKNLGLSSENSAEALSHIMDNIQTAYEQTEEQTQTTTKTNERMNKSLNSVQNLDSVIENQSSCMIQSSASIEEIIGNISSVGNAVEKMNGEFNELIDISDEGLKTQNAVHASVLEMVEDSKELIEANILIAKIANQTNLLSMNAAIEAAHAGEAGAGFSVVADEIRKLADNSGEQSKSISAKLSQLTNAIDSVVKNSENSKLAFNKVSDKISLTNNLVTQINSAMTEQKSASQEVLEALREMSGTVQDVQSTSKEMKEGVLEVNEQLDKLTEIGLMVNSSLAIISDKSDDLNSASQSVSDMAHETNNSIESMENLIGRFKV